MNIRDLRKQLGDTQSEFSKRYNIPFRTIQNWESNTRKPPQYILELLENKIKNDLNNKKTLVLPKYDSNKLDLPNRSDYIGSLSWLKAVKKTLGNNVVFALDEALMCQGYFNGHNNEYLIFAYGDDSLLNYNGVVLLGNNISDNDVEIKDDIAYTNFNRTVFDALANEKILDMQGTIEAISKYYYKNNKSFKGIFISPEYQNSFNRISKEAIEYYNS